LEEEVDFDDYILYLSPYEKFRDLEGNALELTRSQTEVVKEMYRGSDYDFFFYLVSATDWLQHSRFDTLMSGEPADVYEECMEIFREVDELLQWFLDELEEDGGNLVVMSDHGFREYEGAFYANSWLRDRGFLESTPEEDSQ
ncbi:MAG: alkaline phosphatase family protein, partial [Candidatus Nanohaloarchaea archaeon]